MRATFLRYRKFECMLALFLKILSLVHIPRLSSSVLTNLERRNTEQLLYIISDVKNEKFAIKRKERCVKEERRETANNSYKSLKRERDRERERTVPFFCVFEGIGNCVLCVCVFFGELGQFMIIFLKESKE